jgi:hypothetical protein
MISFVDQIGLIMDKVESVIVISISTCENSWNHPDGSNSIFSCFVCNVRWKNMHTKQENIEFEPSGWFHEFSHVEIDITMVSLWYQSQHVRTHGTIRMVQTLYSLVLYACSSIYTKQENIEFEPSGWFHEFSHVEIDITMTLSTLLLCSTAFRLFFLSQSGDSPSIIRPIWSTKDIMCKARI